MARVVLTQPQPRVGAMASALRARGHEVAALSFTRIVPLPFDPVRLQSPLYDWVVAVSPAALEALMHGLGGRWPAHLGLALIGPGSLEWLHSGSVQVPPDRLRMPGQPPYDAEALMRLAPFDKPAGLRVLVARGERGRDDWIEQLRLAGATVDVLPLYESMALSPDSLVRDTLARWALSDRRLYCVFTQSAAVAGVQSLGAAWTALRASPQAVALAIHPRIVAAAEHAGLRQVRLIPPGLSAIVGALE